MLLIKAENLEKKYITKELEVIALNKISFEINKGELVIILGTSGAGKSTLLNILGGMDNITSGNLIVEDKNISSLKEKELSLYRRDEVGFVFQFYNLLPNLNAYENVMLSHPSIKKEMALDALAQVGLSDVSLHFPSQLSGGQQQRVAIARAIVKNPKILLCDEPTGALDSKTGEQIISLLYELKEKGNTVIIVTHNNEYEKIADRIIRLKDGLILENKLVKKKDELSD